MKLRALTIGIKIESLEELEGALLRAAVLGDELRKGIEAELEGGMEVQTVRIATNSFEEWIGCLDENEKGGNDYTMADSGSGTTSLATKATIIAQIINATGIEFCSLGPALTVNGIRAIPTLLKASSRISASAALRCWEERDGPELEALDEAKRDAVVEVMVALAQVGEGLGNFRFAAGVDIEPNTPFFPVAFHDASKPTTVSIGTENSDLVVEAFENAGEEGIVGAAQRLQTAMNTRLLSLEALVRRLLLARPADAPVVVYGGIDTSINPSIGGPNHSLVRAYEMVVGEGRFGKSGTLAVSEALTRVVYNGLPGLKKVGFCGLMLPAMEDHLLAARASQHVPAYGISDLLAFSAVCGVGIDTVPVSLPEIQAAPTRVKALLLDMAALSRKKGRPLACRLFPVVGGKVGDMTTFDSPYLVNCAIFALP
ncbi:hypothetical protein VYU27_003691 [Nannochloropsis oceanica]